MTDLEKQMADALRKAIATTYSDSLQAEWLALLARFDAQAAEQAAGGGEAVAWQERQEIKPGVFGEWYDRPSGYSLSRPREIESGGIRYQFRPLYTHPAPAAPVQPVGEREAFELWCKANAFAVREKLPDGRYYACDTEWCWLAWQARASMDTKENLHG